MRSTGFADSERVAMRMRKPLRPQNSHFHDANERKEGSTLNPLDPPFPAVKVWKRFEVRRGLLVLCFFALVAYRPVRKREVHRVYQDGESCDAHTRSR